MRPIELQPLFASAQSLTGIGPRLIILLKKAVRLPPGVTEPRIVDLLWHLPTGVIDRRAEPTIADAVPGTIATLKVRVLKHRPSPRGNTKAPYKVSCEDDTGRIDLVFFHADRRFIERQLPDGEERYISGRVERYGEKMQMTHPDYIVAPDRRGDLPLLEPVYPLTAGLSGKVLHQGGRVRRCRAHSRPARMAGPQLARKPRMAAFPRSAFAAAPPADADDVSAGGGLATPRLRRTARRPARARPRAAEPEEPARPPRKGDGRIRAQITDALPFALTGSQRTRCRRSKPTWPSSHRMLRLLQGDVGSGKTVVALMAMAIAVEAAPRPP